MMRSDGCFWDNWVERNTKIFDNMRGEEIDCLWERVPFWAFLWASISSEFRDTYFFGIFTNWNAAIFSVFCFFAGYLLFLRLLAWSEPPIEAIEVSEPYVGQLSPAV